MILEIILSLFPGFFIVSSFFKKELNLSKIMLFFLINIMIMTFLGVFFGFNELTFKITGGLTQSNLRIAYILIDLILFIVFLTKRKLQHNEK